MSLVQTLNRDSRNLGLRPLPPRPVSLIAGVLQFNPPQDTRNLTHYRVYNAFGQLFATIPHTTLPAGRTVKLTGYDQEVAFLSSWDSRTDLESYQSHVRGTAATPPITSVEYTLTAASTDIDPLPATNVGDVCILFIFTDATDGRQIVWDTSFKGVTSNDIDNRAEYCNVYTFILRSDNNWWLTARQHYPI